MTDLNDIKGIYVPDGLSYRERFVYSAVFLYPGKVCNFYTDLYRFMASKDNKERDTGALSRHTMQSKISRTLLTLQKFGYIDKDKEGRWYFIRWWENGSTDSTDQSIQT